MKLYEWTIQNADGKHLGMYSAIEPGEALSKYLQLRGASVGSRDIRLEQLNDEKFCVHHNADEFIVFAVGEHLSPIQ